MDTGLKFQAHGVAAIEEVKQLNDAICLNHGLTVPEEKANIRYTAAEKGILERPGQTSWKMKSEKKSTKPNKPPALLTNLKNN